VFDFGWEREAGELLDSHPAVAARVKNDRLGCRPCREAGTAQKCMPDFVVELKNGDHLIVEIKGQLGNVATKKGGGRTLVSRGHQRGTTTQPGLSTLFRGGGNEGRV
jgi:hypothetical protein